MTSAASVVLPNVFSLVSFSHCDCELRSPTFTVELYLGRIQMNEHAKYPGQRAFVGKLLSELFGHTDTQTQRTDRFTGPLKWSVKVSFR